MRDSDADRLKDLSAAERDGAKYTTRRRGTLQPLLASTLQVVNDRILVDRWLPKDGLDKLIQVETAPVYLDVRSVRNPSTRARNVRYRVAASPGWQASFRVVWENTVVSENEMRAVARDAGQFVGLGDARSIGFGRFKLMGFQMEEMGNGSTAPAKRTVVAHAAKKVGKGPKEVRQMRSRGAAR
jgi:hypothetical protein